MVSMHHSVPVEAGVAEGRKDASGSVVDRWQETRSHLADYLVSRYLACHDWKVRENSNMAYSLQGLNNFLSTELVTDYWLYRVYPNTIREAHLNGDFHVHDLGSLSVYCVGWDLAALLREGFRGAPGKAASSPAKHLSSALGQIVNFFYTLQGEAAGAQALANLDTLLAPFIRYDGLDDQQLRQLMQEFVFNLNVPTRVGFQSPFTNITLDLTIPSHLANEPVMCGGQPQPETYGEFQEEVDRFNQAFYDVMLAGDAEGRSFTFPIPTVNITPEFEWDNPRHDGLWAIAAKYGTPYFANFINSTMKAEDARSMCCRLRLDNRELRKRGGGLFGANPLTGSIGVVTLNLARLGRSSRHILDFKRRLVALMDLAKESLELKRTYLEAWTRNDLYPYIKHYLNDQVRQSGEYWSNHFSTIGLVGMNEACLNLIGEDISSPNGHRLAQETLTLMREQMTQYQATTGNLYNLEATPAEGASYRLARLDRENFPDIISANQDGEPFYTNATQLPVGHTADLFHALEHQDSLQTLYTGGTVFHAFLGERVSDPMMIKRLVRQVFRHYHLPYLSITPTFSVCPNHGYMPGEVAECPHCERPTEVYSRVVGYLRPVSQWNDGKQQEFMERVTYRLEGSTVDHSKAS